MAESASSGRLENESTCKLQRQMDGSGRQVKTCNKAHNTHTHKFASLLFALFIHSCDLQSRWMTKGERQPFPFCICFSADELSGKQMQMLAATCVDQLANFWPMIMLLATTFGAATFPFLFLCLPFNLFSLYLG